MSAYSADTPDVVLILPSRTIVRVCVCVCVCACVCVSVGVYVCLWVSVVGVGAYDTVCGICMFAFGNAECTATLCFFEHKNA